MSQQARSILMTVLVLLVVATSCQQQQVAAQFSRSDFTESNLAVPSATHDSPAAGGVATRYHYSNCKVNNVLIGGWQDQTTTLTDAHITFHNCTINHVDPTSLLKKFVRVTLEFTNCTMGRIILRFVASTNWLDFRFIVTGCQFVIGNNPQISLRGDGCTLAGRSTVLQWNDNYFRTGTLATDIRYFSIAGPIRGVEVARNKVEWAYVSTSTTEDSFLQLLMITIYSFQHYAEYKTKFDQLQLAKKQPGATPQLLQQLEDELHNINGVEFFRFTDNVINTTILSVSPDPTFATTENETRYVDPIRFGFRDFFNVNEVTIARNSFTHVHVPIEKLPPLLHVRVRLVYFSEYAATDNEYKQAHFFDVRNVSVCDNVVHAFSVENVSALSPLYPALAQRRRPGAPRMTSLAIARLHQLTLVNWAEVGLLNVSGNAILPPILESVREVNTVFFEFCGSNLTGFRRVIVNHNVLAGPVHGAVEVIVFNGPIYVLSGVELLDISYNYLGPVRATRFTESEGSAGSASHASVFDIANTGCNFGGRLDIDAYAPWHIENVTFNGNVAVDTAFYGDVFGVRMEVVRGTFERLIVRDNNFTLSMNFTGPLKGLVEFIQSLKASGNQGSLMGLSIITPQIHTLIDISNHTILVDGGGADTMAENRNALSIGSGAITLSTRLVLIADNNFTVVNVALQLLSQFSGAIHRFTGGDDAFGRVEFSRNILRVTVAKGTSCLGTRCSGILWLTGTVASYEDGMYFIDNDIEVVSLGGGGGNSENNNDGNAAPLEPGGGMHGIVINAYALNDRVSVVPFSPMDVTKLRYGGFGTIFSKNLVYSGNRVLVAGAFDRVPIGFSVCGTFNVSNVVQIVNNNTLLVAKTPDGLDALPWRGDAGGLTFQLLHALSRIADFGGFVSFRCPRGTVSFNGGLNVSGVVVASGHRAIASRFVAFGPGGEEGLLPGQILSHINIEHSKIDLSSAAAQSSRFKPNSVWRKYFTEQVEEAEQSLDTVELLPAPLLASLSISSSNISLQSPRGSAVLTSSFGSHSLSITESSNISILVANPRMMQLATNLQRGAAITVVDSRLHFETTNSIGSNSLMPPVSRLVPLALVTFETAAASAGTTAESTSSSSSSSSSMMMLWNCSFFWGGGAMRGEVVVAASSESSLSLPPIDIDSKCCSFNGQMMRKSDTFFDPLRYNAAARFNVSTCVITDTVSHTESISIVPECAAASFVVLNSNPASLAVADVRGQQVRFTLALVPESSSNSNDEEFKYPGTISQRRVPVTQKPAGQEQREAFTVFKKNATFVAEQPDASSNNLDSSQLLHNSRYVFNARSFDPSVATFVSARAVAPRQLELVLYVEPRLDKDTDYAVKVGFHHESLACRGAAASSSSTSSFASWPTVQITFTAPQLTIISRAVKRGFDSGFTAAATLSAFLRGNPMAASAVNRARALNKLVECDFSDSDPLETTESPFQFGWGPQRGYFQRGALFGNFLLGAVIYLVLFVTAYRAWKIELKWHKEEERLLQLQQERRRGARRSRRDNNIDNNSAEVNNNNNDSNNDDDRPSSQNSAARRKSSTSRKSSSTIPFLPSPRTLPECMHDARLHGVLFIPTFFLVQGTLASAVSLIRHRASGVNDAIYAVLFGLAPPILLYFWMMHLMFVKMPASCLRYRDDSEAKLRDEEAENAEDTAFGGMQQLASAAALFPTCVYCTGGAMLEEQKKNSGSSNSTGTTESSGDSSSSSTKHNKKSNQKKHKQKHTRRRVVQERHFWAKLWPIRMLNLLTTPYGSWIVAHSVASRRDKQLRVQEERTARGVHLQGFFFIDQIGWRGRVLPFIEGGVAIVTAICSGFVGQEDGVSPACSVATAIATIVNCFPFVFAAFLLDRPFKNRTTKVFSLFSGCVITLLAITVGFTKSVALVEFPAISELIELALQLGFMACALMDIYEVLTIIDSSWLGQIFFVLRHYIGHVVVLPLWNWVVAMWSGGKTLQQRNRQPSRKDANSFVDGEELIVLQDPLLFAQPAAAARDGRRSRSATPYCWRLMSTTGVIGKEQRREQVQRQQPLEIAPHEIAETT